MTACGNSIPDMTREQEDLVTQYAAGALLERLNDSGTRLVDTSKPKEEPTLADAATVAPEGKSGVSENDIATDEAPEQAMENKEAAQISATQLLQIEPLTITYTGYEICDSYPEQGEEDRKDLLVQGFKYRLTDVLEVHKDKSCKIHVQRRNCILD